ncbi:cellulase family glycosylhydrolase [Paenibacillus sp. FSL W8-1187]|uniref:cellulase family glycosylhydrolase n=1 Tax=Paenibacillus sp. FSL W8-1187 TaxID=2975339 RepID=UPI0030D9ED84
MKAYHKRWAAAMLGLAAAAAVCAVLAAMLVKPEKEMAMDDYVKRMQPGWNLGNTFDAIGDETSWGNPRTTKDLVEAVAGQGYRSLRLPVTWFHRTGPGPEYRIDPAFLDRIQEVVDWSLGADLLVMLNLHHDSGEWIKDMQSNPDEVKARYEALWRQIAERFRGYPEQLMFESVNEPRFSDDWNKDDPAYFAMLDELNVAFHEIVRGSGGGNSRRPLVLSSMTASASQARLDELLRTMRKMEDERLIATIHYYGYYPFSVNLGGATTFDERARRDLEETFDRVAATFSPAGIPVVLGEFGLLGFDKSLDTVQQGEKLKYFEHLAYYAREKGFATMLWDNGQHFNRLTRSWPDARLRETMVAGWTGRSSTTSPDTVYMQAGEPAAEAVLQLDLNGNRLQAVAAGERTLKEGADYTAEDGQLKLSAALLSSLVGGQAGDAARLTLSFSGGADWDVFVAVVSQPVAQDSTGSIEGLAIPVAFGGERLSTLEAEYEDGGVPGPGEWTPFKEYGLAFAPSYPTGDIMLKKPLLESLQEGRKVRLRLHFGSGAVLSYSIVRAGSKIEGKAG